MPLNTKHTTHPYLVLIQVTWNTTNKNFMWCVLNNRRNNACNAQQEQTMTSVSIQVIFRIIRDS